MSVRPGRTRRVVAATSAVTLLASAAGAQAATGFTDVDDASVHAEAIGALADREIVRGHTPTTFLPDGTVTRAQLASMVARAADLPPADDDPFGDTAGSPHAPAIAAAHEAGLVLGYEDGTFRPSQPIQRAQIAAVLDRWLQPPAQDGDAFSDLARTVHRDAINALAGIDVALGSTDGTFRPTAPLRRDQAASLLWRAVQWHDDLADRVVDLTVLGTSDLHAHVLDWDYYTDAGFADENVGLARTATLIEQLRDERGEDTTLLVDNGDTFQGNPLGSYFATEEPITDPDGPVHPVAEAMNAIGFDALALGNHEFNYGLDYLAAFDDQVDFPLLGANVLDAETGEPAYAPYTIVTVEPEGHDPIEVGILGLTTPGSAVWDRTHVEGQVTFQDGVEAAERWVPVLRDEEDVDVVIVSAHAGIDGGSSYGDAAPPENFVRDLVETVPGIDAALTGHSHQNVPEERIVNEETGAEVPVTQPGAWGRYLSVIDLQLEATDDGWQVRTASSDTHSTAGVEESPTIVELVADAHEAVVAYVNATIGESLAELRMEHAYLEDVAALDFVNHVQAEALQGHIDDGGYEDLPVLSVAAPFNTSAVMPEGEVSIRDIAGMYIYDNTMVAVELTGAELEDYLEWSAEFFEGVDDAGPIARDDVETTKPTYNYDVVWGVEYDLDLAQPVGDRVTDLTFEGEAIDPDQRFAVAINNYRVNGGGGAPHVVDAPIVWDSLLENRQLLIDWVLREEVVDPDAFHTVDWRLTADGEPIEFTD